MQHRDACLLPFFPSLLVVAVVGTGCPSGGTGAPVVEVLSGADQTGYAREELQQEIVLRVVAPDGTPARQVGVSFVVTEGGGSVFAASAITDDDGVTVNRWTLGGPAPDPSPQALDARVVIGTQFAAATIRATAVAHEPQNLRFSVNPATATAGVAIEPNGLQADGDPPDLFEFAGLPAGLVGDADTGVMSGVPTQVGGFIVVARAQNSGGAATADLELQVFAPLAPQIVVQPADQTVSVGGSATFRIEAEGTGALTTQWFMAGAAVFGATASVYATPPVDAATHGVAVYAEVRDPFGGVARSNDALVLVEGFLPVGAMATARDAPGAALLDDGTVLVVGGGPATAERFNPATGTFAATGSAGVARRFTTATPLPGGDVLVTGGETLVAELFDPVAGTFRLTGSMTASPTSSSTRQVAVRLEDGDVLIGASVNRGLLGVETGVERYDADTGTFVGAGTWAPFSSATRLTSGLVLLAGGEVRAAGTVSVNDAGLYDPATGAVTETGSMGSIRVGHTATLLDSGVVLIAGGGSAGGVATETAELYDPTTGRFRGVPPMEFARSRHTATLLEDGRVLLAGGATFAGSGDPLIAEVFDPASESFSVTGALAIVRIDASAVRLGDGRVLVVGGHNANGEAHASAEIWTANP